MDWSRARPLLERLLTLPEERRQGELERVCADDPELRRHLAALLAAGRERADLLEPPLPAQPPSPADPRSLAVGDLVGPWRLQRVLGAGGMGEVWLAQREDTDFKQRAAVKLVKRGMDTDELLRRFRRERRVLAQLEHQSVPRLVDGGSASDGRPYLAMEYVDGVPIDAYLRSRDLDLNARLRLFLTVCEVVQHAHEHGVVHRDLKPSNVLVTPAGEPKLLDFGISRVLKGDADLGTLDLTLTGQQMLTPRYASPEQVRGGPVGPATDIYALGLLLWELLVGRPVLQLESLTQADLREAVCEQQVSRPSSALDASATAQRRSVAGDLDTICLMALRKEPERRYASARQLADDLRRHLEGHPVLARMDTVTYRVSKFVRRNRVLVGGVCSTFVVLLAGLVAALVLYGDARHSQLAAERTAYTAGTEAAEAALRDGNVATARRRLEETPAHLRGWEWDHLVSRLDRSRHRFGGFGGYTQARVGVTATTNRVAAGTPSLLAIYEDSRELLSLPASSCSGVAWSPDGEVLAWCDLFGGVFLLDVAAGLDARRCLVEQRQGDDGVAGLEIAWSPDAQLLAVSYVDGSVRILDASTGERRAKFTAHEQAKACGGLAWHPDGRRLASAGWDETVQLYDVAAGEHLGGWRAHPMGVEGIDFDPSGERLVTGSVDGTVIVWDLATRAPLATPLDGNAAVSDVSFLDADRIAVSDVMGRLRIYEWRTGRLVRSLLGHGAVIADHDVAGSTAASIDSFGTLRLWDVEDRDLQRARTCEFTDSIVPAPDGRRFATSAPDEKVRIWSLAGHQIREVLTLDAGRGYATRPDWSPDGTRIATAHLDAGLGIWDTDSGEQLHWYEGPPCHAAAYAGDGRGVVGLHEDPADPERWSVLLRFHSGGGDGVREGSLVPRMEGPPLGLRSRVVVDREGAVLAVHVIDRMLALPREGELRDTGRRPHAFAWLDHPARFVTAEGARCEVRDPESDALLQGFEASGAVESLAWHPRGTRLAVGGAGSIEIWDPDVPARTATLHGPPGFVYGLAWTPDGSTLLAVDDSGWLFAFETR